MKVAVPVVSVVAVLLVVFAPEIVNVTTTPDCGTPPLVTDAVTASVWPMVGALLDVLRVTIGSGERITFATLLANSSINHRLPSGPVVISIGWLVAVGMGYSVKLPEGVTLATLLPKNSVNHRFPSGPAVIPVGWLLAVGMGYSVKLPEGVTLATLLPTN